MVTRPAAPQGAVQDGCAEQRAAVARLCDEAHQAQGRHLAATEHTREMRRRSVAAQHALEAADAAADPRHGSDEKDKARRAYQEARQLASSEEERAEATATWARAMDRTNRAARLAQRTASKAHDALTAAQTAVHEAERAERAARIAVEAAEAACLDARVRLASCEEQSQAAAITEGHASPFQPHAATGGHAVAIRATHAGEPLVIEALVSGDRPALELAAMQVAEHTGLQPAEALLQLQELVDAIVSGACREGYLVFDERHPFWSHLSFQEARDVIAALARLGFQFEPAEGWHAGRAPSPMDLSMALAYAGVEARHMRDLPNADELRALPQSIGVDARALLAAQAPDLAVDHVVRILDRRAAQLEPLWNEWGQVRPILLSDRHTLWPATS